MKRLYMVFATLLWLTASGHGQSRVDPYSIDIRTNNFENIDLESVAFTNEVPLSKYQLSLQNFADWVDENLFVGSTDWSVLPGTNSAQAALDWVDGNWGVVRTNGWTTMSPTQATMQATFNWLDANLDDVTGGASNLVLNTNTWTWFLKPRTNNAQSAFDFLEANLNAEHIPLYNSTATNTWLQAMAGLPIRSDRPTTFIETTSSVLDVLNWIDNNNAITQYVNSTRSSGGVFTPHAGAAIFEMDGGGWTPKNTNYAGVKNTLTNYWYRYQRSFGGTDANRTNGYYYPRASGAGWNLFTAYANVQQMPVGGVAKLHLGWRNGTNTTYYELGRVYAEGASSLADNVSGTFIIYRPDTTNINSFFLAVEMNATAASSTSYVRNARFCGTLLATDKD